MDTVNPQLSELPGLPDWRPLEPAPDRSYVSGDPSGDRIRVRYFLDARDGAAAAIWFGEGAVGPPGHVHGGAVAAVLDESMGVAAWVAGHPVVAGRLNVDFRQMIAIGRIVWVTTAIKRVEGRKVHVSADMIDDAGVVLAAAESTFVRLSLDALQRLNDQWS